MNLVQRDKLLHQQKAEIQRLTAECNAAYSRGDKAGHRRAKAAKDALTAEYMEHWHTQTQAIEDRNKWFWPLMIAAALTAYVISEFLE